MQALFFVIYILYSLKSFGFSSEISENNETRSGFFASETSENLHSEKDFYLETTQISVLESSSQNPNITYKNEFLRPIPVTSDPLFEDRVWNVSTVKQKRHLPDRGLTHENKMMLLQLHNLYRSNVTPTAGNMAYMEWDDELARLAQIWSDGCIFDHGMPDNDYPETIGQNLYIGTDPTGNLGLFLWFDERRFYDLRKDQCLSGKQCGHYIQMAWYLSDKLGCGMTKCGMRFLITCHYSPQAMKGTMMYRVAKPCSQCPSKGGSLCLKNLCMTQEQCKNNPFDCKNAECNLECLNCGRLNKDKCLCTCADGWDSPDCSYLCKDKHKRCGMSPGWPTKASCSMNNYAVAETYCRKMCDKCNAVNISVSNNTCCDGMLCDEGFVLEKYENSCKCKPLCPGPLCDAVNVSISNNTCCDRMQCDEECVLEKDENSCNCKLLCPGPPCDAVSILISNDTSCDRMLCDEGFVLEKYENSCKCRLLCPGPLCDQNTEGKYEAVLSVSSTTYLNSFITIPMLVFALCNKILRKIF